MAGSSSQAGGSSHGRPAPSHNEAYANAFAKDGPEPLKAADGTKLPFNFSRPEPGFDPNDNSAVRKFFDVQNNARHVLDMAGQAGPTVEEEVERQVRELTRLRGQEVTEEEREIIEKTLRRNTGWLESYKTEVAGAKDVPIAAFNRLAHDYERMQLEMARDRANYEADFTKELKVWESKVRQLQENGQDVQPPADYDPDSNEFRFKVYQLTQEVARKDRLITKLEQAAEETKGNQSGREGELEQATVEDAAKIKELEEQVDSLNAEVERLKTPGSEDSAADQSKLAEIERTIGRLKRDLGEQTENANNWKKQFDYLKQENQALEPQIKDLEKALANKSSEESKSHGQELAQLKTKASELEAQLEAEKEKCQGEKRKLQEVIDQLRQNGNNDAPNHDREVAALRASVEKLEAQRTRLERELEQIQNSDKGRQRRVEELERQLSSATEARKAAQDSAEQFMKEVETLHKSNQELHAENQKMKRLDTAAESGVPGGDSPELLNAKHINTALNGKISELEGKLAENKEALAKAEADLKTRQAQVSDLERAANDTTDRIATLQGQLDAAKQLLQLRNTRIGNLEAGHATAAAQVQGLEESIATLRTELAEANDTQREGQEEIARLRNDIQTAQQEAANSLRQRDDLQARLDTAPNAQQAGPAETRQLKDDLRLMQLRLDGEMRKAADMQAARGGVLSRMAAAAGWGPSAPDTVGTNTGGLPQDPTALRTEAVRLRAEVERVEHELVELNVERERLLLRDPGEPWFHGNVQELARIRQENATLRTRVDTLERRVWDARGGR